MKTLKLIVIAAFILLAFTVGDSKSEYIIPYRAFSITTSNINLDENKDIIIGNFTSWQQSNPTITILTNEGIGDFIISDTTLSFCGYQKNIIATKVNTDDYPDIISFYSDFSSGDPERFIRVLYNDNGSFTEYSDFNLNSSSTFTNVNYGDFNGDSFDDIAVIINNDFLWGILYNDGTGNFSIPEYFDLTFPPIDIACSDLNDDNRADVVISGSNTEIYFSTETGFQQMVLTTTLSHDVLISDFDNDGDNDVITHTTLGYPNHRVYLFENIGNNQFIEHDYFPFTPFCSYAQMADFNNDSLPDMVFTGFDNEGLYIYSNIGNFQLEFDQFIQVDEDALLHKLTCADFDNNNFNDIALIKGYLGFGPSVLELFFNNGMGGFQENPVTKINNQKSKITNPIICYPNPFNVKTTIEININRKEFTNIEIYDLKGNLIKTFINNTLQPGIYKFIWDGKDEKRKEVNKGLYLIRLKAGRKIFTQRVVYL